jgi:cell division transport system permease protein
VRLRFFLAEALTSIRSNAATTVAATLTVLIVTLLLGATITIGKWVYDNTVAIRSDVTVKVYFKLPPDEPQRSQTLNSLANDVKGLPYFKSMEYVSPEDAVKRLSPKQQDQIKVLPYNPLPPAFYVKVTDPEHAGDFATAAGVLPAVKGCDGGNCVVYGKKIADRVLYVTKIILGVVAGLMVLLGIAAVVLIANTIRLSIFSRRREIEVMKLVGATNWFVRLPFVLEGMLTGLFGALAGVVLLLVAFNLLERLNGGLGDPLRAVGAGLLVAMLAAFGVVLGAFGSGLTLRRFLRV